MAIERGPIVDVVMDALNELTDDYSDDAKVARCMLILEIEYDHPEEDDRRQTTTQWRYWPTDDEPAGPFWLASVVREGTRPEGYRG